MEAGGAAFESNAGKGPTWTQVPRGRGAGPQKELWACAQRNHLVSLKSCCVSMNGVSVMTYEKR